MMTVLMCGCSLSAPTQDRQKALSTQLNEYVNALRAGDMDRVVRMVDAASWRVVGRDAFREAYGFRARDLQGSGDWQVVKVMISDCSACTVFRYSVQTTSSGNQKPSSSSVQREESDLWVWKESRWWLTIDSWEGRNRGYPDFGRYKDCVTLNQSQFEPEGPYREELVASVRTAVRAMEEKDCSVLVRLMARDILIGGDSSWDPERFLKQQCSQWVGVDLDAISLSEKDVQWAPEGYKPRDLQNPVIDGKPNYGNSLSCWKVFVPFKRETIDKGSKPPGLTMYWLRTREGLRLASVKATNYYPI